MAHKAGRDFRDWVSAQDARGSVSIRSDWATLSIRTHRVRPAAIAEEVQPSVRDGRVRFSGHFAYLRIAG